MAEYINKSDIIKLLTLGWNLEAITLALDDGTIPTADVVERSKINKAIAQIEKLRDAHDYYLDHVNKGDCWEGHTREHYDASSGKASAYDNVLEILKRNIGE